MWSVWLNKPTYQQLSTRIATSIECSWRYVRAHHGGRALRLLDGVHLKASERLVREQEVHVLGAVEAAVDHVELLPHRRLNDVT